VRVWEWGFFMKILSYNLRGLGRWEKRREVQRLVTSKSPLVFCIQDTKLQQFDDNACRSLWGSESAGYSYRPSNGVVGGIITLWKSIEVDVSVTMSLENVLIIKGCFINSGVDFAIVNVYAPCDSGGRACLWERILTQTQNDVGCAWCSVGDFNAIRSESERKSRVIGGSSADVVAGLCRF